MKIKKTSILMIALIVSIAAFAQKRTGIKGGINFANLYVQDVDDENMKIGFNAGIYHRVDLSDAMAFQPELLFTQKGATLTYSGSIVLGSGEYRYGLNYLEVPLLFVAKIGNFNIQAGPYLATLLSAKIKDVNDDGSVNNIERFDRDDFNTFDFGAAAGIGFDFDSGIFGLRYNYGFNEIGEDGSFAGQATNKSKNSAFQIYAGFDF
ncbi:MAG: PorT family protein [Cyclobacteriaceae bacterium]